MRHLKARTAHLFRTEGARGVLAGARRRLRGMRRALFTVERYVIFSFETDVRALPSRRPDVDGLEVVVLESEDDMRGLSARGFEVLEFHSSLRKDWLRRGGVAFCAYVNREPAHVAWVAMTVDAMVCARARLVRVLGFRWWREEPMSGPCPSLTQHASRRQLT